MNKRIIKKIVTFFVILICFFTLWSITNNSSSLIVQEQNIHNIFNYLKPSEYNNQTLIVFDIDNTIATPAHSDLGSDQWFYFMLNQFKKEGMSHEQALSQLLPMYNTLQKNIQLRPVEEDTISVIKQLQEKGVIVIALTARNKDLIDTTIKQLNNIGINFGSTPLSTDNLNFSIADHPSHYFKGIIFTGSNDKGEVLVRFIKLLGLNLKKVIFLDDKLHYVQAVAQAMKKADIPYVGIRYGHLDTHVARFNAKAVSGEFQEFCTHHPEFAPTCAIHP